MYTLYITHTFEIRYKILPICYEAEFVLVLLCMQYMLAIWCNNCYLCYIDVECIHLIQFSLIQTMLLNLEIYTTTPTTSIVNNA